MKKYASLVDLPNSFPTSIYLEKAASTQPTTSLSKLGGDSRLHVSEFTCITDKNLREWGAVARRFPYWPSSSLHVIGTLSSPQKSAFEH